MWTLQTSIVPEIFQRSIQDLSRIKATCTAIESFECPQVEQFGPQERSGGDKWNLSERWECVRWRGHNPLNRQAAVLACLLFWKHTRLALSSAAYNAPITDQSGFHPFFTVSSRADPRALFAYFRVALFPSFFPAPALRSARRQVSGTMGIPGMLYFPS